MRSRYAHVEHPVDFQYTPWQALEITTNRLYQHLTMAKNEKKSGFLQGLLERLGAERRIHYELAPFKQTLEQLGNPGKSVHSLIIAGTNGKGTTALLVSAALKEAGFKVSTFLSPHLQTPNERLLLDLKPIDDQSFEKLIVAFLPLAQQKGLSYFEFLTLLHLVRSEREKPDFQVLEVGLGGRLDATNVTDPIACAITSIDFDHQDYLGNTKLEILHEKLGVLNSEGLLFTGAREPELLAAIEKRCQELDSIYYYSKELKIANRRMHWNGQSFTINGYPFELTNPTEAAAENATTAFLMLRIVFPQIPLLTVQKAFGRLKTPGRFEVVQERPRVILSGDHNPAGIESLLASLKRLPQEKLHILCAFSADKPFQSMYQRLQSLSDSILLTRIRESETNLPTGYREMGQYEPSPKRALEQMLSRLKPEDTLIITGSLYLVGELRSFWQSEVDFLNTRSTADARTTSVEDVSNRSIFPPREPRQIHVP